MYISSIKDSLEMIGCKNVNDFLTEKLYTIVDGKVEDIHVVKQRNVTIWNNKNNSNSSYTSGVAEDHLNKWVLCDSSYETEKYNISKDKFKKRSGNNKTLSYFAIIISLIVSPNNYIIRTNG